MAKRFLVQQKCPLKGWDTWVIFDEKVHANTECARRIGEAPLRDKNSWRVIPEKNENKPVD